VQSAECKVKVKKRNKRKVYSVFIILNAFCGAKSFLHILRSKIFHICRKANISHGEAVFHPFRKEWISPKTPAAFSSVGSLCHIYAIKKTTPCGVGE
jgi:hypothetical protein